MTKMSNEFLIENQMQFEQLDSRNMYMLEMPHSNRTLNQLEVERHLLICIRYKCLLTCA